ncbi:hypothetical protein MKX01_025262 [Papaver californicum]|nr:hypothetical protein MKX01_025262 [Papaver californicum]
MESTLSNPFSINDGGAPPSKVKLLSSFSSTINLKPSILSRKQFSNSSRRFSVKCSNRHYNFIQRTSKFVSFSVSSTSKCLIQENSYTPILSFGHKNGSLFEWVRKSIVLALFCIVIGFVPVKKLQKPAIAVSFAGLFTREEKKEEVQKDHEYSDYTQELLGKVSVLLQRIEEAKSSKGDIKEVRGALEEVKLKKEELRGKILDSVSNELREPKSELSKLVKRSEEIFVSATKKKNTYVKKVDADDEEKEKIRKLEKSMEVAEKEYDEIAVKIDEIEDMISRTETMAYSIGLRELSFIAREAELLVERFVRDLRSQSVKSAPDSTTTKLSRSDILRDLEMAQRECWEQMILPAVLDVEDDSKLPTRSNTKGFVVDIKNALEESRELQSKVEARIRQKMGKFGDEKQFLVTTPVDEVVKGYPEAELKWMFGEKEVVVPKAIQSHLFHGWKKWREEAKADLKRDLLEDTDFGKQYIAQRQERILLERDRVVGKTWYNDEKKRWEMDPIAVPYAVSKKLVESARIRHDWGAMYVGLKGDDKEYYVNVQEYETLFEDFGGFDGLYLKLLASGVPTAVQLMWIPLTELDLRQQFLLIATHMVIQYGWGPDDSPAIYYASNATTALSMGDKHEYEMAAKVEAMYNLAYDKANEMLQKNSRVLQNIVDELLEFEILTGKDLERIFVENGGIQEKEPFFLSKSGVENLPSSSSVDGGSSSGLVLLGVPTT